RDGSRAAGTEHAAGLAMTEMGHNPPLSWIEAGVVRGAEELYSISMYQPRNCHSLVVPSRVSANCEWVSDFYEQFGRCLIST
ncbi:MAG TPA: hypothetical protein VHT51_01095, partial [Micropepsaceae bacterium]|nr:hypothetical protein [Micropepsaceae bacterium]